MMYLAIAAEFIKEYRKTGQQSRLKLMASADAAGGVIDPYDVGVVAAHLISQDDTKPHNQARYVLNGPEDISGKQVVEMVEEYIGGKVEKVEFKDMSFVDEWAASSPEAASLIMSIKFAPVTMWEGKCTASITSREVLELAAPKRRPGEVMKSMLGE